MLSVYLGEKKFDNRYVESFMKKNALMYISLYPKDLHYWKMNDYIKENYNISSDLYSICYYIIARSRINRDNKKYSVVIYPEDEFLYKLITFGNREVKGIDIINKALTTIK